MSHMISVVKIVNNIQRYRDMNCNKFAGFATIRRLLIDYNTKNNKGTNREIDEKILESSKTHTGMNRILMAKSK